MPAVITKLVHASKGLLVLHLSVEPVIDTGKWTAVFHRSWRRQDVTNAKQSNLLGANFENSGQLSKSSDF